MMCGILRNVISLRLHLVAMQGVVKITLKAENRSDFYKVGRLLWLLNTACVNTNTKEGVRMCPPGDAFYMSEIIDSYQRFKKF